jgi:hypothetical protein
MKKYFDKNDSGKIRFLPTSNSPIQRVYKVYSHLPLDHPLQPHNNIDAKLDLIIGFANDSRKLSILN